MWNLEQDRLISTYREEKQRVGEDLYFYFDLTVQNVIFSEQKDITKKLKGKSVLPI
jgi:hypothetical protein